MFDYIIAGVRLRSQKDIVALGLRGFKPFEANIDCEHADCTLSFVDHIDVSSFNVVREIGQSYLAEADADSSFSYTDNGYLYSIKRREQGAKNTLFYIDRNTHNIITNMTLSSNLMDISILRFGIWVMFGVVLAAHNAIAIHSSVIVSQNRGVLFLGESGTGKSTHTRLWRENIDDAKLLNDDSPIIRIVDGGICVYGSPWSGKTPCYKNENYPIAGFCRLAQAPYNKIQHLKPIMAIGALLPSCPPIFAHDESLQDQICATLGEVVCHVPVYRLECLPNKEAAELSHTTIIVNGN